MPDLPHWQTPTASFGAGPVRIGDTGPAGQAGLELVDVEVYRAAPDTLLASGETLILEAPAAGDALLQLRVTGDAAPRLRLRADGRLELGDGAAAPDTVLYRPAANMLRTDDTLVAAAGTVLAGAAGYTSRALTVATEYMPSATRPTLVSIIPTVDCDKNESATIQVYVGPAGGAAILGSLSVRLTDADTLAARDLDMSMPFTFVVPAGQVYKLTATVTGAPTIILGSAREMTL